MKFQNVESFLYFFGSIFLEVIKVILVAFLVNVISKIFMEIAFPILKFIEYTSVWRS